MSQDKAPLGFLLAAGCPLSVRVAGSPLLPDMAGLTKIIIAGATYIVSNGRHFRELERYDFPKVDVCNLLEFLDLVRIQ